MAATAADAALRSPLAAVPDSAGFVAALGAAPRALTALPWDVARGDDESAPAPTAGFVRADGAALAVALPGTPATALVELRCGGGFVAVAADPAAPSVGQARRSPRRGPRRRRRLAGAAGWTAGDANDRLPRFAVDAAGGHAFRLGFAAASPAGDAAAWARRPRATLVATPFTVRAVLHDCGIGLAAAVALDVGDVVPIDTRHDIALCLGDRARPRHRRPDGGGYRVTIVAASEETA